MEDNLTIIPLAGTIDKPLCEAFLGELAAATGDVIVLIDSPGGDVYCAYEMYMAIIAHNVGNIVAHIDGQCASAATLIACACDFVTATWNSQIMFHRAIVTIEETTQNGPEFIRFGEKVMEIDEVALKAYKAKGMAVENPAFLAAYEGEKYMDAKQAQAFGFVDHVDY